MKNKIIINADDLGYSKNINDEIFNLIEKNKISSATIIANAPAFNDAIQRAANYPKISFGIHLNATEFQPLTKSEGLSLILDSNGNFINNEIRKIKIDRGLRKSLYNEWLAQIEKIRSNGIVISHIDSHHHVHTIPSVFTVIKKLQISTGILKLRSTLNVYKPEELQDKKFLFLKKIIWNTCSKYLVRTKMTDKFSSFNSYIEYGHKLISDSESIELMTHPGNNDFIDETNLLKSNWELKLSEKYAMISYNDL